MKAAKEGLNLMFLSQEICDNFIKYLINQKNLSQKTVLNYASDLKHYLNFLHSKKIEESHIELKVVREYLSQLYEAGYARTTIARRLACLRTFFKYLFSIKMINNNPLVLIRAPKKLSAYPSFYILMK